MAKTIIVLPNQSMLDVIIMAVGSLEGGMVFCADNDVSISDVPVVGTEYQVSDAALAAGGSAGAAALKYFVQNGVVVGTLGASPPCPAPEVDAIVVVGPVYMGGTMYVTDGTAGGVWSSNDEGVFTVDAGTGLVTGVGEGTADVRYTVTAGCGTATVVSASVTVVAVSAFRTLLAPYMEAVYTGIDTPAIVGFYDYKLVGTVDFVNYNALAASYLDAGVNNFESEYATDLLLGNPSAMVPSGVRPMTDKEVDMHIAYSSAADFFVWDGDDHGVHSVTYADVMGNTAECCPVVIFQGALADIAAFWIGDIAIDFVSTDGLDVTMRLTRSSTGSGGGIAVARSWLYDALGGSPDPGDPTNDDKTFVRLPVGVHRVGVEVEYTLTVAHFTYPGKSRFVVSIEVY